MSAIKFEAARYHLLSDVFVAAPSLLLKLSQTSNLVNHFGPSCPKPLFQSEAKCESH